MPRSGARMPELRYVTLRFGDVGRDHTEYQREADADRKRHRHARDVDGRDQQDVGQIEDDAARERRAEPSAIRLREVDEKAASVRAAAAQGECQQQRQQEHAEHVIPVEQLEAPLPAGELLGVGPRAPTEHGHDAQADGQRVGLNGNHLAMPAAAA